jgi:hypothetical protein
LSWFPSTPIIIPQRQAKVKGFSKTFFAKYLENIA